MAAHEPVCGRANIMDVIDKGEIYLTFVFDGIDSTSIGVASVSDGSTYDTPILPSFSDNSLEVDGYDGRYYFNTRLTQKDFTYNCFIDNLSAFEFDQLKSWIRPKKIGKLIRPEEPYRYYWVKVSSVDNLANIPLTHPDTGGVSYTGNFNVTFTTIGQACGYGMFYYQDDLKYYEYKDIFNETQDYYYDTGLLYREEVLPLHIKQIGEGIWGPQIYNPGTYISKLKVILIADKDITNGAFTLTNNSTGDVAVISLVNVKKDEKIIIDWGNNTYTKNGEDYAKYVSGDLMYLQPRNYVEKIDTASVYTEGDNTYVKFDASKRQVRKDDIGKSVMFKSTLSPEAQDGAGGRITDVLFEENAFVLSQEAGKHTNSNASVIITTLDELTSEINGINGATLDIEWQVEPRYL